MIPKSSQPKIHHKSCQELSQILHTCTIHLLDLPGQREVERFGNVLVVMVLANKTPKYFEHNLTY